MARLGAKFVTRELANNWNWLMPLRRPLPGDARRRTATRNASPGPFGAPCGLRSENVGFSDYRLEFFMNSFYDTNDVLSSSRRTSSVSLQGYMPACGLCAIGLSSSFRWHSGESFDRAEGKVRVVVAAMFRVDYVGRRGS